MKLLYLIHGERLALGSRLITGNPFDDRPARDQSPVECPHQRGAPDTQDAIDVARTTFPTRKPDLESIDAIGVDILGSNPVALSLLRLARVPSASRMTPNLLSMI